MQNAYPSIMSSRWTLPERLTAGKELILLGFPLTLITILWCVSNASWQGCHLDVTKSYSDSSVIKLVFVLHAYRLIRKFQSHIKMCHLIPKIVIFFFTSHLTNFRLLWECSLASSDGMDRWFNQMSDLTTTIGY
jgi:hypothetical protein